MVVFKGTNSLVFHPQGDRFTYHTGDDVAAEGLALQNVLAFCEKLGEALKAIFDNVQPTPAWWLDKVDLDGDAQGRVPVTEIRSKANIVLASATVPRSKLPQILAAVPAGIVFYGSMDAFPPADSNPGGPSNQQIMSFTVELDETAMREYYWGTDGKLHCSGLLPVYMDGEPLVLTDGDHADGAIQVCYSVDFVPTTGP